MGKTTDRLVEMMQHAARGSAYSVWCLFDELAASTFRKSSAFWGAGATGVLGKRIAPKFRDLHGLLIDL
jgi:hypothetical protein